MSSFDEYRKKLQKKYGTTEPEEKKVEETKKTSTTVSSTSPSVSTKSSSAMSRTSFDDYREKLKEKYSKDNTSSVISFEEFDSFMRKGAEVSNPSWKDSQAPLNIFGWKPFGDGDTINNMVTFAEANKNKAMSAAAESLRSGRNTDKNVWLVNAINTYMHQDEKKAYNYLIGKGEIDKANEYLSDLEDIFRQREAKGMVDQVDGTALELLFSAVAGLDQFASGVKNLDNYITGKEADPISSLQYAQAETSSNNKGLWKVANDLTQTTTNMLPSIMVGTLTSGIGTALTLGVSSAGNAYADMRRNGYNEWQSRGYGFLVGASEAVLQKFLGGISALGGGSKGVFQTVASKVVPKLDNAIARVAVQLGGNMLDEGLEEAIQEVLDPVFKMAMTGEDFEGIDIENVLYSGLLGMLSAGVLEGGPSVYHTVKDSITANKIYGDNKQDLVTEALEISPENAHAQRMQERLDNGKKVSGYQINRLVNTNEQNLVTQDKGKMKSAVESRLSELGETGDMGNLSDVIVKAQSGEKLTSSERKTLINSKYGRRVSTELNPQSIESGEYTSQWAENIGTERINTEAYNKALYDLASEQAGFVPQVKKLPISVDADEKEIATESKFGASEDGKTKIGDTEVSVKEIASIKDGEVTLRLEDGTTVNASDVTFGSDEALLYENVVHMGFNAATANAFINNYEGNMPVAEYALDFRQAYRYGELGIPKKEIYSEELSSKLSDTQKSLAYDLGKTDAKYKASENESLKAKITSTDTIKTEKIASKGKKKGKLHNNLKPTNETQRASLKALGVLAEALDIDIYTFESPLVNGRRQGENGSYDPVTRTFRVDLYAGVDGKGTMLYTAAHELTHDIREKLPAKFKAFADFLFEQYGEKGISVSELIAEKRKFLEEKGRITPDMTEAEAYDLAYEEVVADACESFLADGDAVAKIAELKAKDRTLWQTIKDFITKLVSRIKAAYEGLTPDSREGRLVAEMLDSAEKLKAMWVEMVVEASEIVEIDQKTESVSPMLSERTWTASEYVTEREKTAKAISKALGVDIKTAYKYIDDINGVARLIADDRARLDYEPNLDEHASVLKPNSEYKYSVDMSTLCAKRLLFTGTFDAIQRALPNTVFDSEDIVALREMMQKRDYEVACGICYVESTRREIGRITQDFIDSYKKAQQSGKPITRVNSEGKEVDLKKTKDQMATTADKANDKFFAEKDYTPTLADLNTTDIDLVKRDHPLVYEAYLNFMNARGQAKPKLLETRAEYKGEILKHFKYTSAVNARNNAGGLRLQSFSDFEVPHMIDMMQIVMDMSRVGLKSQAYTKVPAFAEIFGESGVKINLSLIAKGDGLDANGNLVFDDVEGINHKEAFKLRDKYSKNVGTILVGKTDAHIIAAMADPRIDYIIPFHKSSWKESLYDALGLTGYADYTDYQNEKPIDKDRKIKNFDPSEYWDFTKSGDENAQIYLEKCREDGRIPKFPQFQGYPGYWKLLIDFKMYDNDGIGSPQEVVKPIFDTEASERILGEYKGGHKSFPVAKDVVEDFVKEHKDRFRYSDRNSIDNKWDKGYNLYTTTDDFIRQVPYRMRHAFARSLANKTSGMTEGEIRTVHIYAGKVYAFRADGYMHGEMVGIVAPSELKDKIAARKEYKNEIDTDTKTADLWFKPIPDIGRGSRGDISVLGGRGRSDSYDTLSEDSSERYTSRYTERERQTFESKEEIDEIVKKLREMYGLDTKKYSDRLTDRDINDSVNGAEYNGKEFWIAVADLKGNIVKTWTHEEAHARGYDLDMDAIFNDKLKDGYRFFTTDLIEENGRIEFDDYGDRLPDEMIERINEQITIKNPLGEDIDATKNPYKKYGMTNEEGLYQTLTYLAYLNGDSEVFEEESTSGETVADMDYPFEEHFDETFTFDDWLNFKFSDRDPDSVSNRSLLANALESVAQNDIERNKLKEYKSKIALIESEQAKLAEIRGKIKEMSFAKGARDNEAIKKLRFEENQTANRINTYDRQLLSLEATTALKGVLEREKQMAYKRAEQKGKEALKMQREKDRERNAKTQRELMTRYQESRKKNIEGRKKTEMRYKIKKITSELDTLLRNPTAKKHIKEELRAEVAGALLAINMDTVGAEERLAEIRNKLQSARDPFEIEHLLESYNRISLQGDKLKDRLDALRSAYEKIKATDDIELSLSYQEVIQNSIKAVSEKVGNTSIRNMTLEQLEMVYDLFKMIRHTVRDANKSFKAKKGETIMQMAEAVNDQVRTVGGQPYKRNAISVAVQRVGWTFLKPYVAFRTIGSITLTNLYNELRVGEDTFYEDVREAQAFIEEQYKKHNYKSWDMKKTKTFTAKSGKTFDLTLEQMMTLYAYSKREQAHKHIIEGGVVFEDALVTEKNKWGIPIKYEVTTKDAFNLSEETFAEIANSLSAEQKAFVDEMQKYLSVTMGAKGNEVSMELLGVKLFKEEFYLPIKSSQYYRNFSAEEAGEVKLKSPAFSKETVPHANNPIVLHSFTDLWAEHINDMSMYHSFVLALEDFTRVYNYKTKTDAKVETMDTKATLETAYPGVTKYISKFLKDMNGGVRGETVGWAEKLTSLTKKGAVLGSASVAIQQPSAVMRAMAMVNPKYFVTTAHKSVNLAKHKQDFEELKKYAPIAGIKEMGRFDVGMGQGTVDWIKSNKTLMEKGEDVLSAAPAFMDEVTWVSIWNAVKRETVHTHKDLRPNSEEFLKVAGERFTDVISMTQVYDSVFSRSDLMRNKSLVAKWLTAFMAEPTTTLNMLWDSWVQAKRTGGVKAYAKATVTTGGAVVASIVLNAALKALVTAGRDDDEDESYAEKYLEHFFGDLNDSLNPLTLIPVVKDIVSIFNGYDVERMDMALFSDLKNAIDAFDSDNKNAYEKWSGLVGAISAFFGVPVKNVERDIRAVINTIFGKKEDTTKAGLLESIKEGWTGKETANGQQLYEAMMSGDTAQIERVKDRFKDQNAINSAIRKALRDNDPRIKKAAKARYNGDISEYMRIAKEIIAEGHFKQDDIVAAINSEINSLKKGESTTESSTSDKVASIYKMDDYYAALVGRDQATAYVVKEDLIKTDVANGKDRDEAEADFNSKFTSHLRELYEDGEISDSNALNMLVNYGGKSEEEAYSKVQYWAFKEEYPDYDLSEEAVNKYYNEVEPYGIGVDVYYDYYEQRSECKGTDSDRDGKTDSGSVKSEVLAVINSLPISSSQKDVLYFLNGWAASKLHEAPWR